MNLQKYTITLLLLLQVITSGLHAQQYKALNRSVPEAEGVSSRDIINFLEAVDKSKHELHSLMVLRHGKVVAEGWWNPYSADLKHTMYSVSKSFTSTAIGFAVNENLLSVNDKVVSFFPEYLPDTVSNNLAQLSIKHLLSMTAGQQPDPTLPITTNDSNWVKAFLAIPVINTPGSKFLYNSMATYMLSAIIQKVSGQKLVNYLQPRLFTPLGITGMDWEVDARGINTGGWGLRVKTEDMAKLGQLYLQKGKWNGKQLLPAKWIDEATTAKIDQAPDAQQSVKDSSDWMQGYCYQFWRSRHNSYRGDGAFGQFILVLPAEDAVIVITAETSDMQDELNLVWKYLLPSFKKGRLPNSNQVHASLKQKLSSLSLTPKSTTAIARATGSFQKKTVSMQPNSAKIESASFAFLNNRCLLNLTTSAGVQQLVFGKEAWVVDTTTRRGPNLLKDAKANQVGLAPFVTAGTYTWTDKNTLKLVLRFIEGPHRETFTCSFENGKVLMEIENSVQGEKNKIVLEGKEQ